MSWVTRITAMGGKNMCKGATEAQTGGQWHKHFQCHLKMLFILLITTGNKSLGHENRNSFSLRIWIITRELCHDLQLTWLLAPYMVNFLLLPVFTCFTFSPHLHIQLPELHVIMLIYGLYPLRLGTSFFPPSKRHTVRFIGFLEPVREYSLASDFSWVPKNHLWQRLEFHWSSVPQIPHCSKEWTIMVVNSSEHCG